MIANLLSDPFTYLAVFSIVSSIMVVSERNVIRASVMLGAAFFSFACLYFYLGAPFVAVIQILLYTSSVAALLLFVIMLVKKDDLNRMVREHPTCWRKWTPAWLALFVIVLVVLMVTTLVIGPWDILPAPTTALADDILPMIGTAFLTKFVLAFELVSLLLFVAVIGAIILARRKDPPAEVTPGFDDEVKKHGRH